MNLFNIILIIIILIIIFLLLKYNLSNSTTSRNVIEGFDIIDDDVPTVSAGSSGAVPDDVIARLQQFKDDYNKKLDTYKTSLTAVNLAFNTYIKTPSDVNYKAFTDANDNFKNAKSNFDEIFKNAQTSSNIIDWISNK